jgi:hypothetical protein
MIPLALSMTGKSGGYEKPQISPKVLPYAGTYLNMVRVAGLVDLRFGRQSRRVRRAAGSDLDPIELAKKSAASTPRFLLRI